MIPPGATIGILGGGQLGRMTAMAAAELGYRTHVFTPEEDSPAAQVTNRTTVAAYDDIIALDSFAKSVDVVTFEFENVPAASLALLESLVPVRPKPQVLAITQHRVKEKSFINAQGIATAPFAACASFSDACDAAAVLGLPLVLKTCTLGYDGKGQRVVREAEEFDLAWRTLMSEDVIAEGFIAFEKEISVIAARGLSGEVVCYDVAENVHEHHILARTHCPARVSPAVAAEAERIARTLVTALDVVGLLAVEMFVTADDKVLVNELAPRPHNSGHHTLDACATSQFQQLVRAVCGLPLGAPTLLYPCEMQNLIGDDITAWADYLREPLARPHLYGKIDARHGRKMGHVTRPLPV